jgi:hypothetical protein
MTARIHRLPEEERAQLRLGHTHSEREPGGHVDITAQQPRDIQRSIKLKAGWPASERLHQLVLPASGYSSYD